MIDFRYHLVSLIAVFLAVALGIVIGTTALNEPILADIKNQVTALEQDKRSLEDRTQQLQAQLDTTDAFAEAVAPALVDGALAGSKVLLVVTNEDVAQETVDEVTALIGEAGGTVSGTLSLQPEYSDPSTAASLQNYVTGSGLPAGRPAARGRRRRPARRLAARPGADDPAGAAPRPTPPRSPRCWPGCRPSTC